MQLAQAKRNDHTSDAELRAVWMRHNGPLIHDAINGLMVEVDKSLIHSEGFRDLPECEDFFSALWELRRAARKLLTATSAA